MTRTSIARAEIYTLGRMARCTSRQGTRSLEIAYESAGSWVRAVPLEELAASKTLASPRESGLHPPEFSLVYFLTGLHEKGCRNSPTNRATQKRLWVRTPRCCAK